MALSRNTVILAKIESTYGTDPTPSGSADAMLPNNDVSLKTLNGQEITRDFIDGTMGGNGVIRVGEHSVLSFSMELAGAGSAAVTAGTAPKYGVLLRACGLDETITATTDTQYAPVSTGHESATVYVQRDGIQHKLTGVRGTVSFNLSVNRIPTANFNLVGIYNAPTTTANATPDYTAYQQPLPVSEANTPTLTIHGYSAYTTDLSIDYGSQVEYRNMINYEAVRYLDRNITGSISFEEPALTDKNFYSISVAHTEGAVQYVHGGTTGAIIQFDASYVQMGDITQGDANGYNTLQCGLHFNKSTGDDEFLLTVK